MAQSSITADVVERQERERAYHRDYAATQAFQATQPPLLDILARDRRKWWNSHWRVYDCLLDADLTGKQVLVAGCGLGDDACRLATLGAEVHAFDISPELVAIARERATRFGFPPIHFATMPAENTTYPDRFFDVALYLGVFHHISIGPALIELDRIMKPGALLVAHEQYTHSALQRLRDSDLVNRIVYPRLRRVIYGTDRPYITEDEKKLDETQIGSIFSRLSDIRAHYFCLITGRFFPTHIPWASRWDQRAMRLLGPLKRYAAGQVVFAGTWRG